MPRQLRRATTCLNCDHEVTGNFCSACGQENTDYRVSLRRLAGDVVDELFQLESRLWRTLWTLLSRPGRLTLEYNAGRRVRFTPPLRLYLLASVAYFFVVSVHPRATGVSVDLSHVTVSVDSSPADGALLRGLQRRIDAVNKDPEAAKRRALESLFEWAPRVMAILLPLFALLTFLFFRRPRRFFVEHLIFALHTHAVAFLLLVASDLVRHKSVVLLLPSLLVWVGVAARRVFQQSWWRLVWKLPLIGLFYTLLVATGTVAIMLAGIFNV